MGAAWRQGIPERTLGGRHRDEHPNASCAGLADGTTLSLFLCCSSRGAHSGLPHCCKDRTGGAQKAPGMALATGGSVMAMPTLWRHVPLQLVGPLQSRVTPRLPWAARRALQFCELLKVRYWGGFSGSSRAGHRTAASSYVLHDRRSRGGLREGSDRHRLSITLQLILALKPFRVKCGVCP